MKKWIELFPIGVSILADNSGPSTSRPILMLKSRSGAHVLPVWLSPLDAGITLSVQQVDQAIPSPYELTGVILKRLNVRLDRCLFTELKGHHLFVELSFEGSEKLGAIQIRADKVMSFCLQMKTRFFAQAELIEACRTVEESMYQLARKSKSKQERQRPKYLN